MHANRTAFLELRGATVLAQRTWRMSHRRAQAKAAVAHERARVVAATRIQAVVRGRKVHSRCVCVCVWWGSSQLGVLLQQ